MDLSLTPAQTMIKDSARDLLARECPHSFLRQLDDTETGFDPDIWARISDLGWVGQVLPAEYGGGGGTDGSVRQLGDLWNGGDTLMAQAPARVFIDDGEHLERPALSGAIEDAGV